MTRFCHRRWGLFRKEMELVFKHDPVLDCQRSEHGGEGIKSRQAAIRSLCLY